MHPHAVDGALVSLAAMWRLPVLHSLGAEHSLRILQFLADQVASRSSRILRRYDRKPKRLASRRLYLLQGLPGVGPALAHRLLCHFGSVETALTVDAATLAAVRGIGRKEGSANPGPRRLIAVATAPSCSPKPTIYIDRRAWSRSGRSQSGSDRPSAAVVSVSSLSCSFRASSGTERPRSTSRTGSTPPWRCSGACSAGQRPTRRRRASGVMMNEMARS